LYADARVNLGRVLQYRDREAAQACYRRVLTEHPGYAPALAGLTIILELEGQLEACIDLLEPHLDRVRGDTLLTQAYARVCRRVNRVPAAVAALRARMERVSSDADRSSLLKLLAQCLDDQGHHDDAFAAAREGNALACCDFDPASWTAEVREILSTFTPDRLTNMAPAGPGTPRLVFIVGMPRSGTTLLEQMIDTHPSATGMGELPDLPLLVEKLSRSLGGDAWSWSTRLDRWSPQKAHRLARKYRASLVRRFGDAPVVVDKLPLNYLHLGLITRLFPEARILHCTRDALDTGLSCYFQRFDRKSVPYATDLAHLGAVFRDYQTLMDHWHQVLPRRVLDVPYEQVVSRPEATIRGALDFIGLPWDPGCLSFHENSRMANTASYAQVHRPLYSSSIGRHHAYRTQLQPFRDALAGR
jgi:hypothetical protein